MRSMSVEQVAHHFHIPDKVETDLIKGFSVDSRLVKSGELFFALQGARSNGHEYLQEIKNKGAIAAVVSKNYTGTVEGLPLLRVNDPLLCLQELAQHVLHLSRSRIVAITGSVGKTSTKEITKTLLSSKYVVAASPGNSNSQIGLPLTILNQTNGKEEILILEMGMTHPGQLTRLVQIAPPEVALITNIALVHACNFESIEDIAWAKAEIFSHSATRLGVLYRDISNFADISQVGDCHKISFSTISSNADYFLDPAQANRISSNKEKSSFSFDTCSLPGKHMLHNLLAAVVVARYFGVDWEAIKETIPSLILPEKRLQFIEHKEILFLNDSYNAAEISVKAALETLPSPKNRGRKIAVLGGMTELGKFSAICHQRVGEFALQHVEELYCLGEECLPMQECWERAGRPVRFFVQRADLVAALQKDLRSDDVVLLKGSRSKELWKVLEEI